MAYLVAGRYRLLERLGEGGTSVVHAAERVEDGALVALKLVHPGRPLPPSLRRRFEREASAGHLLQGPNLVRVEEVGVADDGRPFLVMELLSGRDLAAVVREGPLSAERVREVIAPVVGVLVQAHALGLAHRDLKPENVFLHRDAEGREVVKLLDFGLMKPRLEPGLTSTGSVMGTPAYMAPEQARGRTAATGPHSDVWGLGMLVLALLAGQTYWPGGSSAEVLAALLTAPMYPPSQRWPWLSAGFDAWFLRSCARDPEERWPDVGAQWSALAEALSDSGLLAPTGYVPPPADAARTWGEELLRAPRLERLPSLRESLVGRDAERLELRRRLLRGDEAVLTLVGAGGTGKTALALAVADELREHYTHGVVFVPLSAARDVAGFWGELAAALGVEGGEGGPRERALAALAWRHLLLVLDNLEQLRGAAAAVAELVERAADVAVLATSRRPLGLAREQRFPVDPLGLPEGAPTTVGAALASPAVVLLVRRITQARPGFHLEAADVPSMVALARRLDGLPLAIELAAPRLRTLTPGELVDRLDRRLALLAGGSDLPERHQTLRATLDWSYELLPEPARAVLAALSLFVGGFTLEAAERVVGDPAAAESITLLAEQSWLLPPREGRLGMLDVVREYASDRLGTTELGDYLRVQSGFVGWAAETAESLDERLQAPDGVGWLAAVDRELPNLRAALDIALATDDPAALRISAALAWYWYLRGLYREGLTWIGRALAHAGAAPPALRARATGTAGRLALLQCEYGRAREHGLQALALHQAAGNDAGVGAALEVLGGVAREQGDLDTACAHARARRELALEQGDERGWARATNYLAFACWLAGDLDAAAAEARRAHAAFGGLGDPEGLAWAELNLAAAEHYRGGEAGAYAEAALRTSTAVGFPEGRAWAMHLRALDALRLGDAARADADLRVALTIQRELGDLWREASVLDGLARVAILEGDAARAARLEGAAAARRARIEVPVPPVERAAVEELAARLEAALGGEEHARLRAFGARMPIERLLSAD